MTSEPWWRSAVFYQIYPRSFCDTTGTGVGDLDGIRRHLDHVAGLGVDALWLSPFFRSPMADHGYDVSDYCDVDPMFGTLATVDALLDEAHDRDLRVIIDWVPNHTSDQHPWFVESRSSRDNPKRDWYVWRDGTPDAPPTNWPATFPAGPAWAWDGTTGAWYLHLFTPEQPDLDWTNPEVRAAMCDTLRFWLDRGVDGFRMDVIHLLGKDQTFADIDLEVTATGTARMADEDATHAYLRQIRNVMDEYDDRLAVGEVYLFDTYRVVRYLGTADAPELHLSFNFRPMHESFDATRWRKQVVHTERAFGDAGHWPTWVLSNHDLPRHRTRYGSDDRARAAAAMLLTLRGTPFLYAGEELGLEDAVVPPGAGEDPAGFRDGCRAPIPWDAGPSHGWVHATNWLPWPPDADRRNAETEAADAGSMLALYRRLLAVRRERVALRLGDLELLDAGDDDVLAWERHHDGERVRAIVNFSSAPVAVDLDGDWTVAVRTDDPAAAGSRWDRWVPGSTALVLDPAG